MFVFVTFKGFDNNGGMSGPRSTRQSNPEEHASHYFNSFSKDMLVQVRFKAERTIRSTKVSHITPKGRGLKEYARLLRVAKCLSVWNVPNLSLLLGARRFVVSLFTSLPVRRTLLDVDGFAACIPSSLSFKCISLL